MIQLNSSTAQQLNIIKQRYSINCPGPDKCTDCLKTNPHLSVKPQPPILLWREVPLFIAFLSLIAGMLIAQQWEPGAGVWLIPFAVVFPLSLFCLKRRYARFRVMATVFTCTCLGMALASVDHSNFEYRSARCEQRGLTTTVNFKKISRAGNTIAHLQPIIEANGIYAVVMEKDLQLSVGDTIVIRGQPEPIPPPTVKFGFDQAAYFKTLGISHRIFLLEGDFIIKSNKNNIHSAASIRERLISSMNSHMDNSNSKGILFAMLFGERTGIDKDTRRIYSASGAMHILAISGLHIGIIASILILIFGRPDRHVHHSVGILTGLCVTGLLWFYIWLVGMPPSACRAGGMFSMYLIGSAFGRRSHPLNILGATGVIALLSEPALLGSIGFQFSYLALGGILMIGLPLYRCLAFKSAIVNYVWATVAISIGAQFLLIPVLGYYFNELSTMSIISSLFAIPAAYVIVISGIALIALSFTLSGLADIVGTCLDKFISVLTDSLSFLAASGWSTVSRIYLSGPETIILLLLLLTVCMRVATGEVTWLKFLPPLAVAFVLLHSINFTTRFNRSTLTFFPSAEPSFQIIKQGVAYNFGLNKLSGFQGNAVLDNELQQYVNKHVSLEIQKAFHNSSHKYRISYHSGIPDTLTGNADLDIFHQFISREYVSKHPHATIINLKRGPHQIQLK